MRRKKRVIFTLILASAIMWSFHVTASFADVVPRMAKEELKGLIGSDDVVILDVRTDFDWSRSDSKIKGAIREHPREYLSWVNKYEKGKTIVLYCA